MGHPDNETHALLRLVSLGHEAAAARLLNLHRKRLKKMIACRIDQEVAARHDPSDVVQETILTAASKLPEYLKQQDVPFYAWLRRLAWLRLVELHRQHLERGRGEASKADFRQGWLTSKSLSELVRRFGPTLPGEDNSAPSPSQTDGGNKAAAGGDSAAKAAPLSRKAKGRIASALNRLEPGVRELLLLYYVEQLTVPEIASVMNLETAQVKLRHMRAIRRMHALLEHPDEEPHL